MLTLHWFLGVATFLFPSAASFRYSTAVATVMKASFHQLTRGECSPLLRWESTPSTNLLWTPFLNPPWFSDLYVSFQSLGVRYALEELQTPVQVFQLLQILSFKVCINKLRWCDMNIVYWIWIFNIACKTWANRRAFSKWYWDICTKNKQGDSRAVQWLGLHVLTAEDAGLIPGWGTKILQSWDAALKKKKNTLRGEVNVIMAKGKNHFEKLGS